MIDTSCCVGAPGLGYRGEKPRLGRGVACALLLVAAFGLWACFVCPRAALADEARFRKSGEGALLGRWGESLGAAPLAAEVHPYMPGASLSELSRLESAAAWRQLREAADSVIAGTTFQNEDIGWAYVYRAWGALGENDAPAALNDALMARRLLPHALQPVLVQCIAEARQGRGREAEAALKTRTEGGESSSEGHAALAVFYQDAGDWMSAEHWYGEALRLEPNAARINASMAVVLWRLGQAEKALGFMSRAVKLSPGNADFWNELGMMLLGLGRPQEALKYFDEAIARDGRHCGALLNRGTLFFYSGQASLAEGDFSLGLRIYPHDVALLTSRSRVYVTQGRYEEAQQDLDAAFRLASEEARVLNDFAWFLATCPDSRYWNGPLAVELAGAAIANDKTQDAGLYDTLAAARARAGAFKEAVAAQDEALLRGKAAGVPPEDLKVWEDRLRLYLRKTAYEQPRP